MLLRSGKKMEMDKNIEKSEQEDNIIQNSDNKEEILSTVEREAGLTSMPEGKQNKDLIQLIQFLNEIKCQNDDMKNEMTLTRNEITNVKKMINVISTEITVQIETKLQPVVQEVMQIKNEVNQNCSNIQVVDKSTKENKNRIVEVEKALRSSIEEIKDDFEGKLRQLDNIRNESINSRRDSTAIIVNGIRERKPPIFDGERFKHPAVFIRALESYLEEMNLNESGKVRTAIQCLENDVRMWAEINQDKWNGFDEFKYSFLDKFWSKEVQGRVRLEVYRPRSYNRRRGTMAHHLWYWAQKTSYLDPPITEENLVEILATHYPPEVETFLIGTGVKDVDKMASLLERYERITDEQRQRAPERRNEARPIQSIRDQRRNMGELHRRNQHNERRSNSPARHSEN